MTAFFAGLYDFLTIFVRNRRFLAILVVFCLALGLTVAIFSQHTVSRIPIVVVDHDNSSLSRQIRLFLSAGRDAKIIQTTPDLEQAKAMLHGSQAAAVVYLPPDLSQNVKTQRPANVYLFEDASQYVLSKNVDKTLQTVLKSTSYGVAAIALQKQGIPKEQLIASVQPMVLDISRPLNPLTLYSFYLIPVLAFFALYLFTILMANACYQEAVAPRFAARRIASRLFILGRLCAVYIFGLLLGLIIMYAVFPVLGMHLHSANALFVSNLCVFLLLTLLFVSAINIVLFHLSTLAAQICLLLTMMTLMVSGLTWPLESMPDYVRAFAQLMPATPFLHIIQTILHYRAEPAQLTLSHQLFFQQAVLYSAIIIVTLCVWDCLRWLQNRIKHHPNNKHLPELPSPQNTPPVQAP